MQDYVQLAKDFGFTDAALLPVADLVVVPAYRCFCEENLCGNYDVLPVCPPMSGTVEEMTANMRRYQTALVLTIETTPNCYTDKAEQKAAKRAQNILTEQLMDQMRADGQTDLLMMGAGPWKTASCMSAYCVDAQKMADAVHMKCWENDGKIRYFSLILFGQARVHHRWTRGSFYASVCFAALRFRRRGRRRFGALASFSYTAFSSSLGS